MWFYSEPAGRQLSSNYWVLTEWVLVLDRGSGDDTAANHGLVEMAARTTRDLAVAKPTGLMWVASLDSLIGSGFAFLSHIRAVSESTTFGIWS
jgi:hypothetical protein